MHSGHCSTHRVGGGQSRRVGDSDGRHEGVEGLELGRDARPHLAGLGGVLHANRFHGCYDPQGHFFHLEGVRTLRSINIGSTANRPMIALFGLLHKDVFSRQHEGLTEKEKAANDDPVRGLPREVQMGARKNPSAGYCRGPRTWRCLAQLLLRMIIDKWHAGKQEKRCVCGGGALLGKVLLL